MTIEKKDKKMKYESPELFPFGELARGHGSHCNNGSGESEACNTGYTAGRDCHNGDVAGDRCDPGNCNVRLGTPCQPGN